MRARLELPDGQLAAVAAVQTFGDYLNFHPHLHVLAASGLVDREGRFHVLPVEKGRGTEAFWTEPKPAGRARRAGRANQRIEPLAELFLHRFLALLRDEKLISEKKLRQILAWTHSGFSLDASEKPVAPHDVEGRKRLAEYLLRAPFSLEKITWNESTGKVIYRSKRSWHTKCNFQIFEALDFLAAAVEHIPPKRQQCHAAKAVANKRNEIAWTESRSRSQTVRYYGLYSNKSRGIAAKIGKRRPEMADAKRPEPKEPVPPEILFVLPAPEPRSGRALRPLWRDLIMKVWGEDPHKCPCCPGTMKVVGTMIRRAEVEFFLRLHGLWEPILALPPPPDPPFDIETMNPIKVPPQAIWRDDFEEFGPDWWTEADPDPDRAAPELDLGDGRSRVLDGADPFPEEEWMVSSVN
jgi:hypothetical protein